MTGLRAEWSRLVSLRGPWVTVVAVGLATAVTAVALANDAVRAVAIGELSPTSTVALGQVLGPATQVAVAGLVAFAMQPVTGEVATGSMVSTLLVQPRRGQVLVAKTIVAAVVSAVLLALATVLGGALATAVLGTLAGPWTPAEAMARAGLLGALVAVVAVGLAAALRTAVVTLVVGVLVLVGLVLVPDPVGAWLPAQTAGAWIEDGRVRDLAVLTVWAASLWSVGATVFARRDI